MLCIFYWKSAYIVYVAARIVTRWDSNPRGSEWSAVWIALCRRRGQAARISAAVGKPEERCKPERFFGHRKVGSATRGGLLRRSLYTVSFLTAI